MDQINYKFICTLQIWDKILESVDKVNVALQSKTTTTTTHNTTTLQLQHNNYHNTYTQHLHTTNTTTTIDKASELIKGLTNRI